MPSISLRRFWRKFSLRTQVLIGFLLPLAVLAAVSIYVHFALESAISQSLRAEQRIRSLALYNELLKSVLDAETGERGYVITGQPSFLEPFNAAEKNFRATLKVLRDLSADQSDQLHTLTVVEDLFEEWLAHVALRVIRARRESPADLFGQSYDALYHVNGLLERLVQGPTAEARLLLAADLQRTINLLNTAVAWGRQTRDGGDWARLQQLLEDFQGAYQLALEDGAGNGVVRRAAEHGAVVTALLERLVNAAREAEEAAVGPIRLGEGKALVDQIRALMTLSIAAEQELQQQNALASRLGAQQAKSLAVVLPFLAVSLGLILALLMQFDVVKTVRRLRQAAQDVAMGDLGVSVKVNRGDELGQLSSNFNLMVEQLRERDRQDEVLDSLHTMLASSQSLQEAYQVVARCCEKLFPGLQGGLYITSSSRTLSESVLQWGPKYTEMPSVFAPDDCRGLRIGGPYYASSDTTEFFCPHVAGAVPGPSLCLPLVTQHEVLGAIHLMGPAGPSASIPETEQLLADTVAARVTLALANLRLAEQLRAQSIRDPLTNLFNRRYMEETMERELARARRAGKPLAVLALDVDHFKQFNDRFGHDAGDQVLKALARAMEQAVRATDVACRYGGEEFFMILPDATTSVALQRAESLCRSIAELPLQYGGQSLGTITLSIGVSVFPEHGADSASLFRAADDALYKAKRSGRNRALVAGTGTASE